MVQLTFCACKDCVKKQLVLTLLQEYQEQAREARMAAREAARQAAEDGNHIEPLSAVAQRRLKLDMPYELQGHVRQGVMSRFPHTLQDYNRTIGEMQVCGCHSSSIVSTKNTASDQTKSVAHQPLSQKVLANRWSICRAQCW